MCTLQGGNFFIILWSTLNHQLLLHFCAPFWGCYSEILMVYQLVKIFKNHRINMWCTVGLEHGHGSTGVTMEILVATSYFINWGSWVVTNLRRQVRLCKTYFPVYMVAELRSATKDFKGTRAFRCTDTRCCGNSWGGRR